VGRRHKAHRPGDQFHREKRKTVRKEKAHAREVIDGVPLLDAETGEPIGRYEGDWQWPPIPEEDRDVSGN